MLNTSSGKTESKLSELLGRDRPPVPCRIIVGLSGASGMPYALRLLDVLQGLSVETHLIVTKAAVQTLAVETTHTLAAVQALADQVHSNGDIGASIASGSFRANGMIIAPCSVKTLAEIANGIGSSLLSRAADVTLKERRRLVLGVRETPLHLGHLRNMTAVTEMGAIVAPPMPAFYTETEDLEGLINHQVNRWLDLLGISVSLAPRWKD